MATATTLRSHPFDRFDSKYQAPALRDDYVARTELHKRLDAARAFPLVLVVAPAGYGKTTLLAQWSEHDERPFAWVTLDEADSDPEELVVAIATSMERVGSESEFVLVVDRAEVIDPGVLRDAVLSVLEWLPNGSQLAVASRTEPGLPLASMRGRRTLVELGAGELSMSSVEAASMLRKAGVELDFGSVQALVRRTEGWPVALELGALSLASRGGSGDGPTNLAGDDHVLSEYFRAEFLSALSPATVRFLTRSSVLHRLSGPLCDSVLERRHSGELLARLARTNLPLQPVDSSHEFYRLHELFREMLQTELRRAEPELPAALHRRAADWYAAAGDVDQAIGHASDAGDFDRSGQLLWAHLPRFLSQGRLDHVERWLAAISDQDTVERAPLALAAAHAHLALGSIAAAEQWARSARVALSARSARSAKEERAGAALIEAWAGRHGPTRMIEDATRAYELLPEDSPWRTTCCLIRGTASLLAGDAREARHQLDEGAVRGALAAPHAAALCLAQLSVLALDHDDPEIAGDLAQRGQVMLEQHNLSGYPTSALVHAASTAAGVRQGRVDDAKTAASSCTTLLAALDEFIPWYGAETRILLARGLLALGDVTGARERLAEASRIARRAVEVVVFEGWFDAAWEQFDKHAETALIGVGSLTTAELRVLRFLPTHYSFHEIADRLHVSSNTVKTHVHAVYRKLDASSRSEAVAHASRAGLLGC